MKTLRRLILIVDDDYETLQLLKLALERAGFQVMTAATWDQVEQQVKASYRVGQPIDLIVLDLMMPERSGFDVFRALNRIMAEMPPVIMLTAVTGMQQWLDASDLGVAKYLTKPTTPQRLVEAIKEVLAAHPKMPQPQERRKFPPKRLSG